MKSFIFCVALFIVMLAATLSHAQGAYCERYSALHAAMAASVGADTEAASLIASVQCIDSSYSTVMAEAHATGALGVEQIAGGWSVIVDDSTVIETSSWGAVLVNGQWVELE